MSRDSEGAAGQDADDEADETDETDETDEAADAGEAEDARDSGKRSPKSTQQAEQVPARADLPELCTRSADDAVRDVFCGEEAPSIGDLRALQDALSLNPRPRPVDAPPEDPSVAVDPYSRASVILLMAHSTALSGKLVSPINPRMLILGKHTIMAFQRGAQLVEIASRDRQRDVFNFYLLTFQLPCNEDGSCSPGDLYTPAIESNWTRIEIQDDEQLKNTPSDCRQCHQRGRDTPAILMRELESPWTHFFETDVGVPEDTGLPGVRGKDLLRDYLRAKGDEPYAEVPVPTLRRSFPVGLQNVATRPQPLLFDSPTIESERWPVGAEGYPSQPSRSATWDAAYQAFKRGEQLALPHYEPRVTDPEKQARLTEAYQRYLSGELPADELPDLADIFPDDSKFRAELGLATEPDATPAEALVQACGACHNDVLDQSISRARFNIDLARMDRAELDLAIERLQLPKSDPDAMPPPDARELDDEARERLIAYLRDNQRTSADDALLERAARLGMAGSTP